MASRNRIVATSSIIVMALHHSSFPSLFAQSFSIKPSTLQPTLGRITLSQYPANTQLYLPITNTASATPTSTRTTCLQMSTSSSSNYYTRQQPRKNIRIPLLVDVENPNGNVPLPNSHLPSELTTASLYELELAAAVHKLVIQEAVESTSNLRQEAGRCYGHLVSKNSSSDDLIGAIGCAGEILIGAPTAEASSMGILEEGTDIAASATANRKNSDGEEDSGPLFVLARGSYRFRVKEVVSSIPYPIAIVDELLDDDVSANAESKTDDNDNEEDAKDDDDDDDIYATLGSTELIQRIHQSLQAILNNQLETSSVPLSPLEQSILESASSSAPMAQAIQRRFDAEERIAVFQTFTSSLLDIASDKRDRIYAVAMMAGELANLSSELRVKMLTTVDGVERLRMVLRELSSILAMDSARKMAKSLSLGSAMGNGDNDATVSEEIGTDTASLKAAEDSQKELKVGTQQLPSWANQIQNGIRVEYFWNEAEGWCAGTVVEDPVKIMGEEIIVTVKFDDDGSMHRLPFRGDEKARWRPPEDDLNAFG